MAVIPLLAFVGLLFYVLHLRQRAHAKAKIPYGAQPLPGPKCKWQRLLDSISRELWDGIGIANVLVGYPIVGRVHDVPHNVSWLKFYEWSKEYGPIYQMEIFGSVHVWISSEQIACDLLSRRAAIYSDRPQIPNLPDNRTKGDYLALTGHNGTFHIPFVQGVIADKHNRNVETATKTSSATDGGLKQRVIA
jgi:hypothetical protein